MRRLLIVLAALALLATLPATASAEKPCPNPPCDKPDPGDLPTCVFDDDGVLQAWNGEEKLWCAWTVTDFSAEYRFAIEPRPGSHPTFKAPFLAIKEDHPSADICFKEYYSPGLRFPQSYPKTPEWPEFPIDPGETISLPESGECPPGNGDDTNGSDTFVISTYVQTLRDGEVQLRMLLP